MSRIAKPSPVSAKMYRHFAVLTVIITAGLAMFAQGEQTGAVPARIAPKQAKNQATVQQGPVRLAAIRQDNLRDARGSGGGGGVEYDAGDGSLDPDGMAGEHLVSPVLGPGGPIQRVPDAATYKMTPAEYERLRKNKGPKGPAAPPSPEQLRAASEASALRSGSTPGAD